MARGGVPVQVWGAGGGGGGVAASDWLPPMGSLGKDGLYPLFPGEVLSLRARQEGRPSPRPLLRQAPPPPPHPATPADLQISLGGSLMPGCLGSHFTISENPGSLSASTTASLLALWPRPA